MITNTATPPVPMHFFSDNLYTSYFYICLWQQAQRFFTCLRACTMQRGGSVHLNASSWQAPVTALIAKGSYRFNGQYPVCWTQWTSSTSALTLTPHNSASLSSTSPPWEDALQLCSHETKDPLCWVWSSLPLSAQCLCCSGLSQASSQNEAGLSCLPA